MTEEFKKLGFSQFEIEGKPQAIKDAYQTAHDYYTAFDEVREDRQNSIALLGQPGSGKTHLLSALANNLIRKKGVAVQYFPFVEGFNNLRDDLSALDGKIDRMQRVDVLLIDDLFKPAKGDPRATPWQVDQMYAVINHRYLNHKPVMVSSELDINALCNVDEALGTRIFEMCKDYIVTIQGDRFELNHRLAGAM
ncbi:DNA replication protein DnaC [Geomicrobium sp. JCM 19039]|nr:DNA replication protein DnaC [Geomicrobium sp. JCM 19039]